MNFYQKVKKLTPVLKFLFNLHPEGVENMPIEGPIILCCNHRANIDPILIGAVLPRNLYFMAKAALKIPLLGLLLKMLGAFPVHRGMGDKEAIRKSYDILKEGNALAMFPKGHRQKLNGLPKQFKLGAAQFACKSGTPVLPAAIICKGKVRFFNRKVIRFGSPLTPAELGFIDGSPENIRTVSDRLRQTIGLLLEEKP